MFSGRETVDWHEYLAQFHREHVGAIEELLQRIESGGRTPYAWLSRAVSESSRTVLDLACGTGAVARELARPGRTVIGVDMSAHELAEARRRSPEGTFLRADARHLPLRDASMQAVVSSFGFAVVRPMPQLAKEVDRVLAPGGVVAIISPSWQSLRLHDIPAISKFLSVLHDTPHFPRRAPSPGLPHLFAAHGIRKVEDARERYTYTVRNREDAERLLEAIYLPGVAASRISAAIDSLTQSAHRRPVRITVPMRRFVGIK
ncbi:Methyltransferase domain-containing protein [Raineyella antarctica]|uniref:Methyltransferase domain-containing protein n=2 Tax=Raineyella antarctica TaxID=1577474 RepID=A0A1G6GGN1_9ACTN|nr:Methyltransferase domain-containing protein [Raineyella antarctica]